MIVQDLEGSVEQATSASDEKAETKASKLQAKADDEGNLDDTTNTRDDDMKYLEDLTSTCEQKASDFEQRQQLRGEEIVAIEKAIEIISGGAVSGAADKHLPGLLQTGSALMQLRADGRSPTQGLVAAYLRAQGSHIHSRVLAALAVRVDADPFRKVKKMIKDMITKLMEEANAEAEHKGYCDAELATNGATRKEKTEAVESLHAEIDELEMTLQKLTEDITELTEAVAALDAAVAKATKIREAEKAKNAETVSDAAAAQKAVGDALAVLKDFYAKAAEALVQVAVQQPAAASEATGVIGMLEVIQSDFARLESETKAAEKAGQAEYDGFMTDSEVDKAAKAADIDHKTKKKQDKNMALEQMQGDLDGTQKELDAALAYYEKLKPTCVDAGISYEDRVAARKEEIQSLKEALKILAGDELP